ncbi:MAG TPA: 2OG-Fe(II) oxygenase [Pyrinomonadaceae bacterium]
MNQTLSFVLDPVKLDELAEKYREAYAQAAPFPHIVIDDFLPADALRQVLSEFPGARQIDWNKFNDPAQRKLGSTAESQIGEYTRFLLYQFNSSTFIRFLEKLTGISGLLPDPHFIGGGIHQILRGGFLKIHADFNRHPLLPLDRRLNLLLYLNEDWREEYGGHLELWSRDMSECRARILPVFNRCVIFSTTDYSFHGHPDPLKCPQERTRKSMALYYYSNGRPEEESSPEHGTLFQHRPGESYDLSAVVSPPQPLTAKQIIIKFVPPIVMEAYLSLKRRV